MNLNWSIVADMLLYVVVPTCRSTAEAVQILFSHAFGDAGSPYLIGVVSHLMFSLVLHQNPYEYMKHFIHLPMSLYFKKCYFLHFGHN